MKRYLLEVDDKATAELNEKSFALNGKPAFGLRVLANEISMEVLPTDVPLTQEDLTKAQEKGQKEAWELARKFCACVPRGGYSVQDLREIFGRVDMDAIFSEHSYQEAAQKIKVWEEEKKTIHVGDVVQDTNGNKGVVTRIGDAICTVMCADGSIGFYTQSELIKTGKTVDISAMLDQIKEA